LIKQAHLYHFLLKIQSLKKEEIAIDFDQSKKTYPLDRSTFDWKREGEVVKLEDNPFEAAYNYLEKYLPFKFKGKLKYFTTEG
jgi:hypothetical protein